MGRTRCWCPIEMSLCARQSASQTTDLGGYSKQLYPARTIDYTEYVLSDVVILFLDSAIARVTLLNSHRHYDMRLEIL